MLHFKPDTAVDITIDTLTTTEISRYCVSQIVGYHRTSMLALTTISNVLDTSVLHERPSLSHIYSWCIKVQYT